MRVPSKSPTDYESTSSREKGAVLGAAAVVSVLVGLIILGVAIATGTSPDDPAWLLLGAPVVAVVAGITAALARGRDVAALALTIAGLAVVVWVVAAVLYTG